MGSLVRDALPSGKPIYGVMTGSSLPLDQVRIARERDVTLMDDHGMYHLVKTGDAVGQIVNSDWLDDWGTNGTESLLVAKQVNFYKRIELCQPTPPFFIYRMITSKAATVVNAEREYLHWRDNWHLL